MVNKPGQPDYATRSIEQRYSPDAVVFSGDGEPQTPQSIVDRLGALSAASQLEPDSYSLGGTVEALERRIARELGMEAAIWLPTGTLANHLALRRHCGTRSRVILQEQSHIYHDEGDALAKLSGLNAIPLANGIPYFTVDELQTALELSVSGRVLNPVGAVSIESPVRRQAGQVVPMDDIRSITRLCREEGIPTHLDGARLYMMSAATGVEIQDYANLFDSVYVSMYKYFGAPFGAILAGRNEFIDGIFHDRRMFGGGLSSAYLPAALALEGIDGFADRFGEAFSKAKALFDTLSKLPGIEVREFKHGSNIFELILGSEIDADKFVEKLLNFGIVLPWPNHEWSTPLLHVNTTVLRRSNEEIAQAFSSAAIAS
ncbi:MAG: aminotransferase class I/II-fold pyridoxal phosphate-dependent enzyme [Chloroflexi bacterium]|nr:aminotransferase class I/II-fold pyridoxal phosphate-dependent enzyme [Chloroflexota bacterium]